MAEVACVAAVLASLWLSQRRFRDTFTPLVVYVSVWSTAILLYLLRLINYIELEKRTVLLIGGSIAAYALGCLVFPKPKSDPCWTGAFSQRAFERLLKTLIIVHFAAFVIFLQRMQSQFGLGTYLSDPSQIRSEADKWMKMGILSIPLLLHYPILILSFYDYLHSHRLRWFSVIGMTIPFIQELLWTGRGSIVLFAVTLGFQWIFFRGWRRINRKLLLSALLVGALLVSGFLVLGNIYGKLISEDLGVYRMSDFNVESSTMLLVIYPYMYASSALPTFQEAMADVHYYSHGTKTLYPLARVLFGLGILTELTEWTSFEFYFVPVPNNTYTHLFTFYQDFGAPGVIVLPFLLGLLHSYFYWQMQIRPSFWSTAALAVSLGTVCFSIFICLTSTLMVWECYVVLYLAWRYVTVAETDESVNAVFLPKRGPAANA